MKESTKDAVLRTIRDSLLAHFGRGQPPSTAFGDPELAARRGCFVTLKNRGRLRGCIGQFVSEEQLIGLAAKMAAASACDPRFLGEPVTAGELDQLDIEVSVLSELERTSDPLSLRLGIDGIYIRKGPCCGCFLPQVASETGWDKRQFLSNCCLHKAGLPPDAWADPDTEVYLFSAEVFGSPFKDIGRARPPQGP
jgi:AmmeMemoRadiSam system protein A